MDKISSDQIVNCIKAVRQEHPLIGSVTGVLANDIVAKTQSAVGAFSVIVNMADEAETIIEKSDAFYINVGTLLPVFEDTIPQAGRILSKSGKTWLLDPVGIGVGSLRTRLLRQFKGYKPTIIKGAPAEILSLANLWSLEGGEACDSLRDQPPSKDALTAAKSIAEHTEGIAMVTGETSLITDGSVTIQIDRESDYLGRLPHVHSILAGLLSSYAAVTEPAVAALAASLSLEYAAQSLEGSSKGISSFEIDLLDILDQVDPDQVCQHPYKIV